MVERDHVPDEGVFEQQRGLVEISHHCRRVFDDGEADVVQCSRPLFQKNDREEEFVPLRVDEAGTSASLNSDGVDEVQRRVEEFRAYCDSSQHCFFITAVVGVKDVFKEGHLLWLLCKWLACLWVWLLCWLNSFSHDCGSGFFVPTKSPQKRLNGGCA